MINRGFATLVTLAGIVLGFWAGRLYQIAHRGHRDWQTTKNAVPVLRKAFWTAVRAALVAGVVVIVVMAVMGYWTATGKKPLEQHPGKFSPTPRRPPTASATR